MSRRASNGHQTGDLYIREDGVSTVDDKMLYGILGRKRDQTKRTGGSEGWDGTNEGGLFEEGGMGR
jgi:hypothetical protein